MQEINPGFHQNFEQNKDKFTPDILTIIEYFSKQWFITRGMPNIVMANSAYSAILIKPIKVFQEMFNIEREVIVVFSTYKKFQPRSLDSFDQIRRTHQALRFEEICGILISNDDNIESEIRNTLKKTKSLK